MKKNIAYYLEDTERLSEISFQELNEWVEEMPYSQSLRLLVDLKSEMNPSTDVNNDQSYGVYFAQDYEPLSKKETKILAEKNINKAINEDKIVTDESASISKDLVDEVPPIVTHNLVDDVSEDLLEDDILEISPKVVVVNEVSHEEADEILEAEVENEVLEITLNEVEEVSSFAALDSMLVSDKKEEKEEDDELEELNIDHVDDEDINKSNDVDRYAGLVDYKSFVVGVSDNELIEDEIEVDKTRENVNTEINPQEERTVDINNDEFIKSSDPRESIFGETSKKKKPKKKSKKKGKGKEKENFKNKLSKKKDKLKEDKKKKKSKSKKSLDKKKVKAKTQSISKTKKSKPSKNKISSIKKVKGEVTKQEKSLEPKPVKGKAKKIKKEVKYVVVNEATTNDFKLKNYDGVSKFANWLLEKKSINGDLIDKKMKTKGVKGKQKSKKKKKKKKNKVLKVAQESVKKSEMILSEPLANIMAAQGHTKKAKKMYKQLGLIFPEKSSYFASKIENLKKK